MEQQPGPQSHETAPSLQVPHDEGDRDVAIKAEYVAADPSQIDLSSFAVRSIVPSYSYVTY